MSEKKSVRAKVPVNDIQEFYDSYGRNEWQRLEESIDGRVEYEETVAALEKFLPDSGRVLDAGGGAGRYALWLAERGYEVTLLDLSRRQTELAREQAIDHGLVDSISVIQGSITDLPLQNKTFDAICCLGGPISHLLDERDRLQAVREFRRVSRSEAPVFVSVMGLLGMVQLQLTTGYQVELLPDLLEHGDLDESLLDEYGYKQSFAAAHFFRRKELINLLSDAGLTVTDVVGLEGLASLFHDEQVRENISDFSESEIKALKRTIRKTNDERAVADVSVHMLGIGYA
ncbi:class I SAM-dependent methyltransferase [Halopelagius longus]|uniref:class I SAM-dependent methyltransferase n=1 Tax=Halopelagius longus TaxID=1236180 RepID=UPI001C68CC96|nr:class I SAM-dependent methyltransferase [Halopelagius longus]